MVSTSTVRLGLRLAGHRPIAAPSPRALTTSFFTPSTSTSKRSLSSAAINPRVLPRSKFSALAANPPTATSTPSSFFTPSLCRVRNASTTATTTPNAEPSASSSPPPQTSLDWNAFFTLRTSRRRYSLASSILGTLASTLTCMSYLSAYPDQADAYLKFIPTDPIVSMGLATFAAMFLGWLLGPIVGNSIWRIFHRSRLPAFNIKEKGFYERIKKHRVNPMGAGANNPVPDFYGEKIGSVQGYRRWLKDQRAFNRKRAGKLTPHR